MKREIKRKSLSGNLSVSGCIYMRQFCLGFWEGFNQPLLSVSLSVPADKFVCVFCSFIFIFLALVCLSVYVCVCLSASMIMCLYECV